MELVQRARRFEGYAQQDSQELVQALLEALHEDLRRPGQDSDPPDGAPELPCGTDEWDRALATDASPVSDLFQGQLRSAVRCAACEHTAVSYELFWSLQLPVPATSSCEDGGEPTLEDALDAFCAEEHLEGWRCEKCGGYEGLKRLELWRLPPVLQIHLKRFSWCAPATATKRPAGSAPEPPPGLASAGDRVIAGDSGGTGAGGIDSAPDVVMEEAAAAVSEPPASVRAITAVVAADAAAARAAAAAAPDAAASATFAHGEAEDHAISAENPLQEIASRVPWDEQEQMYSLLLRMLQRVVAAPEQAKFRSVAKSSPKLQADVLARPGGAALLQWAGFRDAGERFDASSLSGEGAESLRQELARHAQAEHDRNWRRERDRRIAEERSRRLPTGDARPIRRWGGMLPSFGRGPGAFVGLSCTKVETRLGLSSETGRRRGFDAINVARWLGGGSPDAAAAHTGDRGGGAYELYAAVQHLGATPFSGHYMATCWHPPSGAWWRFDDSRVSRVAPEDRAGHVLTGGTYVLFFDRASSAG